MYILDFVEKANQFVEPFKQFIIKYHGSPIFWMAAVGIGIFVFFTTYNTLHRD